MMKLRKSAQAIQYLKEKYGSRVGKTKLLKTLWAADRFHIRRYSRTVTGDTYFAMPFGPVASVAKDVLYDSTNCYEEVFQEYVKRKSSYKETGFEELSESDKEALDKAYDIFHQYSGSKLSRIAHEYPEYKKHIKNGEDPYCSPIDYIDFFEDPTNLTELESDPFELNSQLLATSKEIYESQVVLK